MAVNAPLLTHIVNQQIVGFININTKKLKEIVTDRSSKALNSNHVVSGNSIYTDIWNRYTF